MSKVAKASSGGTVIKRRSRVPLVVVIGITLLVIDQQKLHLVSHLVGRAAAAGIMWVLLLAGAVWLITKGIARHRDREFIARKKLERKR